VLAEDRPHRKSDAITGKPTTTQVLRSFRPDGGGAPALLERLRSEAARQGWRPEPGALPTEVRTEKAFGFGQGLLVVTVNVDTVVVAITPADPNL
jgi:hypothetical protein